MYLTRLVFLSLCPIPDYLCDSCVTVAFSFDRKSHRCQPFQGGFLFKYPCFPLCAIRVSRFSFLLSPGVTTIMPRDLKALLGRCRSKHRPRTVFCRRRVRLRHFLSPPSSFFAVSPSLSNCESTASNTISPFPMLSLFLRVSVKCVWPVFPWGCSMCWPCFP